MWMWRMMWMRGRKREGKEMDGGQWGDRGTSSLTTPRYDDSPPIIPPILLIPGKLSSYHTLNNLSTHICLLPGNLLSFSQRLMLRTEHLQFDPQKLLLLISSGATPVAVESVMCRLQLIVAAVLCLDVSASALPDSHFLWKQMEESDFPPWWHLVWTPQHCFICTFIFCNTGGSDCCICTCGFLQFHIGSGSAYYGYPELGYHLKCYNILVWISIPPL